MPAADEVEQRQRAGERKPESERGIGTEGAREAWEEHGDEPEANELERPQQHDPEQHVAARNAGDQCRARHEQRPVWRGRVTPFRRDVAEQGALVPPVERGGGDAIGVESVVKERALGEIAVHIKAEEGGAERERDRPQSRDGEHIEPSRAGAATDADTDAEPCAAEQDHPRPEDGDGGGPAAGQCDVPPPRRRPVFEDLRRRDGDRDGGDGADRGPEQPDPATKCVHLARKASDPG